MRLRVWGVCGHGRRELIGVSVFASREQVRISHGFPFFPR
ncbi:hypothetical protein I549_5069 [Mycobacterium avium subsp. avium 2285 (R)]|nr:hypothetical protein L837_2635 [Mycobacterium avium MAV_061107_1842]ETZ55473.1 hypothetical protein L839_0110 [Mycobacterium avium MAV_120809_2495]ETZ56745.1 hypothetical protein L840_3453 [Mycobacterium sp. MAC_011194_8550]ETZ71943.1 hypothetical protein L841_1301 [Mycobacterium sp. MAC_080597_8934]EUA35968.1 hypothetical protein I549_5069 [Mycobacterium avium subsp. avium 2285 (R)]